MKPQTLTHNFRLFGRAWQGLLPLLALLVSLGSARTVQAQANSNIRSTSVIVDRGAGNGNETFGGKNPGTLPPFNGAQLGTYDISNFNTQLVLNGGTIVTEEAAPDVITANGSTLRYRLARRETDGSFTDIDAPVSINLPLATTVVGNPTVRTFTTNTANRNLLTGLIAGEYFVFVQYEVNGSSTNQFGFPSPFTLSDPPGTFYIARFVVQGVRPTEPPTSTTWTGGVNDNWFDPANWTQGVPTSGKDATIPDFGSGSTVQYPNIYSDAIKPNSTVITTVANPDGSQSTIETQVPGYDNTATGPRGASGPARTRNLNMLGTNQGERSLARLIVGRLEVFGNFNNSQDSFIQRENTTISFTGSDQSITGSRSGFVNMEIDGGGIKTLINNFKIVAGGTLRFVNGILATDIGRTDVNFVELAPSTGNGLNNIPAGRIIGESEVNYLRGFVQISQAAPVGQPQDFGNIGLTMTFTGNDPGIVTVTRNTGQNYASINNGANSKPSIRRFFGVRPGDQQTNNGGLTANIVFRYLDNETRNLRFNNQSLDESKFALFLSGSSGDIFGQIGRDALDTNTNELTKFNVRSFGTFTLSEFTEPLPVTLVSFAAKRIGTNAEITWETVSEQNNRGYEVQVSIDGRTFRTLAFIPSQDANSNRLLRYRYLDTEANKGGVRYYRLRQVDQDGKDHYYGPKVLSFSGSATADARMEAYPNPFQNEMRLTVQSAASGKGQLQILDLTGRVVLERSAELTSGTNDLELRDLSGVPNGTYLLRVVTPAGKPQTQRIIKR
ncbi:T9SS type A sorting domain-containing protein [Hymenobacter yonginensis]|uniref:T9SS type A sorting domain-containing protein n=1 Tax=Hymenobacter yonginensis TaxID=748197 RepID=A0ABY7PNY2_9BACT|nr:T9SS type A sorting domain-containing protein [Hymenobacter yonginensis]WBO83903.1 T9SS type A sorting domain-containing protein [Hymenobacter yonginensis]